MAPQCEEYRAWLADGPRGETPAGFDSHLAACPACSGLESRYAQAVAGFRDATDADAPAAPAFSSVVREVRGVSSRRPGATRWSFVALPLAAGLAVAVASLLGSEPDPAVRVPNEPPQASAPHAPEPGGLVLPEGIRLPDSGPGHVSGNLVVETSTAGAVLRDPGTGEVTVTPGSRVQVAQWDSRATLLVMESGNLSAVVRHREAGQRFEVRTPYAVVRVRGTSFSVSHQPGVETIVRGFSGEVTVERSTGVEVARVRAGEMARVGALDEVVAARQEPATQSPTALASAETRPARVVRPELPRSPMPAEVGNPGPAAADVVVAARQLLAARRDDEAVRMLEAAVLGDANGSVHATLGDAYRLKGRWEESRSSYERAVGLGAPPGVLMDLAGAYRHLGLLDSAAATWTRYVDRHPTGRFAPKAVWELATLEEERSRPEEATVHLRRLVDEYPESTEGSRAFAKLGRSLLDRSRWAEAADLFSAHLSDAEPALAEAALVGMMRVRLGQGRTAEVLELCRSYGERFPAGARADEVRRLREAAERH
jgi:tetratricopeptide (TPR) repeat protein